MNRTLLILAQKISCLEKIFTPIDIKYFRIDGCTHTFLYTNKYTYVYVYITFTRISKTTHAFSTNMTAGTGNGNRERSMLRRIELN